MKPCLLFTLILAGASGLFAADAATERLAAAAAVFREIMAVSDRAIPQDLLDKAHCAVIVPGMKKGAFIVGAKFGRGYLSCRKAGNVGWSAPGA
ncbi:MAG: hypothetical protein H7X76_07055, partial [Prolixibacteraceae bacterium]|nr:hypothetical protein [Burkholderiales bacterium]